MWTYENMSDQVPKNLHLRGQEDHQLTGRAVLPFMRMQNYRGFTANDVLQLADQFMPETPHSVTIALQTLAKSKDVDIKNPRVVRLVARAAQIFQAEPTLWGERELVNLVWSLSKIKFRPQDHFHASVAEYVKEHVSVISPRALSIMIHSYAVMKADVGPQWFLRMALHVETRIREPADLIPHAFQSHSVAALAKAFATAGVPAG